MFLFRLSLTFQVRFTCSMCFFSWNKNHSLLFLVAKRTLLITLTVRPFVCVYICASMPDMTIGLFSPIAPRSTCITSMLASSKYISARAFVWSLELISKLVMLLLLLLLFLWLLWLLANCFGALASSFKVQVKCSLGKEAKRRKLYQRF